jgi:multiple sugar transport system permease protein
MVGSGRISKRTLNLYLPLSAYVFFLLFPFYWMILVSLKPTNDLFDMKYNPFWIQQFTLENYLYLFQNTDFSSWLKNTIIVTLSATSISLVCSVLIGYALARLKFPGSNFLGVGIFLAYLVPPTLLFLPLAQVIAMLGLYNTYWALILTYPSQLIPFASWLLMGYFRTIPKEIGNLSADHPAPFRAGTALGRNLLFHPLLERVPLRPDLHVFRADENHSRGNGERPH